MPPTLAARLVEGEPAYAWGEVDAGGPALVAGTIQKISGRVCSKLLTLALGLLGKPICRGPHKQQPSHDQSKFVLRLPANLSESLIVGRGAFTLTNELYFRPRKRMRPVKARPLYTL